MDSRLASGRVAAERKQCTARQSQNHVTNDPVLACTAFILVVARKFRRHSMAPARIPVFLSQKIGTENDQCSSSEISVGTVRRRTTRGRTGAGCSCIALQFAHPVGETMALWKPRVSVPFSGTTCKLACGGGAHPSRWCSFVAGRVDATQRNQMETKTETRAINGANEMQY